jgi:hypothetical protein
VADLVVVVVEDTVDMVDILVVVVALVVDNRDMDEQVDYLFVVAYKHMVVENNRNLLLDKAYMNLVDKVLVEDIAVELVDAEVELVQEEQYHEKVHLEDHDLGIKDIGKYFENSRIT